MNDDEDLMKQYVGQDKHYSLIQPETKSNYKAIEASGRRALRFKLVDKNKTSYGCSYAHLVNWIYTPDHMLTLTTSSGIYILSGKHLGKIEEMLMEEKIKGLIVYDSNRHHPPAENEILIESLEYVNAQLANNENALP